MPDARFYFDFLSPYSYLASALLARRPDLAGLDLDYRPLPVGSILARRGLRGPGEIDVKRRAALADCLLLAQSYQVPFVGPPRQPFASVPALRSVFAVQDPEARVRLTHRYFHACWGEGQDLEDPEVLRRCLTQEGIDQDPDEVWRRREVRTGLKAVVQEAFEEGVFGVPTVVAADGVVFFGHDRLALYAAYQAGDLTLDLARTRHLLDQPPGLRIV